MRITRVLLGLCSTAQDATEPNENPRDKQSLAAAMSLTAPQPCRFKVIEGPASEWVAQDSYSTRWLNWVRLLEYDSNDVIFFANTHGPLGQCTGQ